ncbi:MAG: aldehyde dehydrogenase family protein [Candidatus Cybelea sp.]
MDGRYQPGTGITGRLDRDLVELREGATRWASLPLGGKIDLLAACRASTGSVADRWAALAAAAKGTAGTALAGEESFTGPWALLNALGAFMSTLHQIERREPAGLVSRPVAREPNAQIAVDVFPAGLRDRLLQLGLRGEVWMQPGVTAVNLDESIAVWYRQGQAAPRVVAVLGAGNVTSIGPLDVLYKLVAEGSVCMLKVHPLVDYLASIFETALGPLVREGYVRFAYGDAALGRHLCTHPLVDAIHVTGSEFTYRAIVAENAAGKPITSELGNVSPAIVLPGEWSERALRYHAEQLASAKLHNDGFNCIALQVLVLPAGWAQREAFIAQLRRAFAAAADRVAYYPASRERCAALVAGRSGAVTFGGAGEERIARTILSADPNDGKEPLFSREAFGPLLAIVSLEAGDAESYLRAAVDFCNERLRGDLAATLIVDPQTQRDHGRAIDDAVAALRYGCLGVNVWSGLGFALPPVPWGAYRAEGDATSPSGHGVVHNSRLLSNTQKAILRAPFLPALSALRPPWFIAHRNQARIGTELCALETSPSPLRFAKIAWLTLTG